MVAGAGVAAAAVAVAAAAVAVAAVASASASVAAVAAAVAASHLPATSPRAVETWINYTSAIASTAAGVTGARVGEMTLCC